MSYEEFLLQTKDAILAITKLSQCIEEKLEDIYCPIIKGEKIEKNIADEIIALNKTIRLVLYRIRKYRAECYKEIFKDYNDNFSYDDVMYGG